MTTHGDSLSASATVALGVQQLRRLRGWSVARLAAACAEAGAPHLNANVLTNVLARRHGPRRNITVDEVLVLASVLDVAASDLLPDLVGESAYQRMEPERQAAVDLLLALMARRLAGQAEDLGAPEVAEILAEHITSRPASLAQFLTRRSSHPA